MFKFIRDLFRRKVTFALIVMVLIAAVAFSLLAAVTIGSVDISISQVYRVIAHKIAGVGDEPWLSKGFIHDIVWHIRLPRLVLATVVGMGLSVVGVIMQAIVKNPLADPYILGISSGASFGATLAAMLGVGASFGANAIGLVAFIGAFSISLLVILAANIGGRANAVKLLLSGMAFSSLFSAFSSFIIYITPNKEALRTITYWLMGSLGGVKWDTIVVVAPIVFIATLVYLTQYRILNLMLLGDETSITLGTDLHIYRLVYLLLASLLIGFIVYCSGMIGFVGLLVPHIARIFFGTDHRRVLPISALIGSIFLIWADVASRIIIPKTELPIGVLTSIIGAPVFIYLMIRRQYGFAAKS